jgi:hypothetical protein
VRRPSSRDAAPPDQAALDTGRPCAENLGHMQAVIAKLSTLLLT